MGRTYPLLFTLNLLKEDEIIDDLKGITAMEYIVQVIMIIVYIAVVIIVMYFAAQNADILILYSNIVFLFTDFTYSMYVMTYRFVN